MDKYPPVLIMESIHSSIRNVSDYPWFILATPFFSKMNDCEDSSYEYLARKKYLQYKSTNIRSKLIYSIFKNFAIGFRSFIVLIFKSKLSINNHRIINNDQLVVDYFVNKKSKNTILKNKIENLSNSCIWLVGSNLGYDAELNKFTIFELLLFFGLIIKANFYLPLRKLGFKLYFLEVARNFNLFYTFKYFLAGRDVKKNKIKRLHFIYEDQPRDRMLIQNNNDTKFCGYIHTSLIHQWRINKFFSRTDVYLPDNLIFNDEMGYIIHKNIKFKNCKSEQLILNPNKKIKSETKQLNLHSYKKQSSEDFLNILIYLPNVTSLSLELFNISKKFSQIYKDSKVILFPHPNLKLNLEKSFFDHKLNKKRDIIISSYRTNKGFELYKDGFKVIYFGSDKYSYYIPFDQNKIPIDFAQNSNKLKSILHAILKKNR